MPELLILCWEFFKTGLFAVGGGLAALPFLSEMSAAHPNWFTQEMLADMIAVSESTPGPIAVNMATYVGYTVSGIFGAVLATFSMILPSIIIVLIVARILEKYLNNKYVNGVFSGLRPAVTGLIAAAGYSVLKVSIMITGKPFTLDAPFAAFDWRAVVLFVILVFFTQFKYTKKIHPVAYIVVAAAVRIAVF
ncbi:MAG: chromate transporter [Clostridiales bacterium]|nr:chromate transporter [Clostridiales bacterium]